MSFFLWNNLQLMAWSSRWSFQVFAVLTNHDHVMLLLMHFLSRSSVAWPQFTKLTEEELVAMMSARKEEELVVEEEAADNVVTQEPASVSEQLEESTA